MREHNLVHHRDSDEETETDSLFDSTSLILDRFPYAVTSTPDITVATAQCTAIPGLIFDPSVLITPSLAQELSEVAAGYFGSGGPGSVNQVMLFGRMSSGNGNSGLPPFLDTLIVALSELLNPHLPAHVYDMLFPATVSASRQAILNHYTPGEGITPHVDLLSRFADGIIAVSLGSGTVMTFQRVEDEGRKNGTERCDLYLPERSVLVLTGDARHKWSHGIEGRIADYVENGEQKMWVRRGARVSITLRWLLPGADIVGTE